MKNKMVKNIYTLGELSQNAVVAKIATTATDGKTYQVVSANFAHSTQYEAITARTQTILNFRGVLKRKDKKLKQS